MIRMLELWSLLYYCKPGSYSSIVLFGTFIEDERWSATRRSVRHSVDGSDVSLQTETDVLRHELCVNNKKNTVKQTTRQNDLTETS
jgi:hypothetical protein